jgi:hypothetical protein
MPNRTATHVPRRSTDAMRYGMNHRLIRALAAMLALWSAGPIAKSSAAETQRWRGYLHLNG